MFFLNFDYFQVVSSPAVKFINDYTVTCSVPRNATEIAETKTRVIFTCNLTAIEDILSYLLHGRSAANLAVCTNNSKKMPNTMTTKTQQATEVCSPKRAAIVEKKR